MEKEHKQKLIQIGVAVVFFIAALLLPEKGWLRIFCFALAFLIAGADVLWRAARNIARGQVFDENFLMSIAGIGAFLIGEYPEGVIVMVLYQVGELFQDMAVDKSRDSITDLMDIRPDAADLVIEGGETRRVSPEEVAVGDTILVKPGSKIPLDGMVLEGASMLDTSGLTGESVPREVKAGDTVLSGCVNLNGVLKVRVEKAYGESTVAKILELVQNEEAKKAKTETFITKFAKVYTPIVVLLAVLLALLPPLLLPGQSFGPWIYRALVFLVMSCPCALVISVPLSFFGGIGGLSKIGVLVKGSHYIEALAKTDTVVFDKTGTLTEGKFSVRELHAEGCSEEELLALAAHAEWGSEHPIAASVKAAYGKELDAGRIGGYQEIAGWGVEAKVDGQTVLVGNDKLMGSIGLHPEAPDALGTVLYAARSGVFLGCLVIRDEIKADTPKGIKALKAVGIGKTALLTGDRLASGKAVGKALGIDEIYAELLPGQKVEMLDKIDASAKGLTAFVGDGINDAPVLKHASLGIAMGALGSDAAIEAADVVIMTDEIGKIADSIRLSRKTLRIARQNIVFAIGVKALILVLGMFGFASMWAAVFADVGVAAIAILNAVRTLRAEKTN